MNLTPFSAGLYECTYYISDHRMVCTPNVYPHPYFDSDDFLTGHNSPRCNCQNNLAFSISTRNMISESSLRSPQ